MVVAAREISWSVGEKTRARTTMCAAPFGRTVS
jgi:hypothetical protein